MTEQHSNDSGQVMDISERTLIEQCKAGRREAYQALYDTYKNRVYATVLRTLGNAEDAEDALQETFVKAFRHIASFKGKSSFSTWLYRIAFNTAIETVRTRKKHENHLDIDEYADFLAGAAFESYSAEGIALEKAIHELPEGYRRIFVLYAVEGYKHHEIAKMLDITEGTSKSQYFQARKRMRKLLSKHLKEL